jgi:hypothetical protein
MKARITRIGEEQVSQHGNKFYFVFFKSLDDGKAYKTCLYLACRNFNSWAFILQPGFDLNTILDGLKVSPKADNLIDADYAPRIATPEPLFDEPPPLLPAEEPIRPGYAEAKQHIKALKDMLRKSA